MLSEKVSVVIPAFNQAAYLREALNSVVSQTYSNLEVLVVDDGSTDGTREMVLEYAKNDARVVYLEQENDKTYGLGARNWGMLNATGKWIALLDQDDIWYPPKIERQVGFLALNKDVSCVFSLVDFINQHGARTGVQNDANMSEYSYEDLILKNYIYVSSGMFSRKLLARAGLPNESSGYADWWLWLSLAKHTNIKKMDEVLGAYRIQADSYQQKQLQYDLQKFAQDNLLTTLSQQTRIVKFPQLKRSFGLAMNQRAKLYLRASYSHLAVFNLTGFVSNVVSAIYYTNGVLYKIKNSLKVLIEAPVKAINLSRRSQK